MDSAIDRTLLKERAHFRAIALDRIHYQIRVDLNNAERFTEKLYADKADHFSKLPNSELLKALDYMTEHCSLLVFAKNHN